MATVCKRKLMPGMTVDVSRRRVADNYGQAVDADTFTVVRLERKYGNDVHGEYTLQRTNCWNRYGHRVTYYHHFEERLRLLNR
jgi:hypothetical protein